MNVEFDDLRRLNLLWAVLLVAATGVYGIVRRHQALRAFAEAGLLERLTAPPGWLRQVLRLMLCTAALVALVAALLGPRWGERQEKLASRGVDVMVLLDVSKSMLARDIAPSRLERAKLSIRDDLLPVLAGDRVGLIAFAGVPTVKCPLTHDYGFYRLALDDVSTQSSPRGGTLIGDAIRKAADSFDQRLGSHRVVLLITDGEDQQSYPLEAARALWQDKRIPIVAVALGDEREGARVPTQEGSGEFLTYQGQTVWSKARFDDLRAIAAVSGMPNTFIPVGTKDFDLGRVYRDVIVPAIGQAERQEAERVQRPSRYHPFAVLALVALLIDSFLRDGPRRADTLPARQPVGGMPKRASSRAQRELDPATLPSRSADRREFVGNR